MPVVFGVEMLPKVLLLILCMTSSFLPAETMRIISQPSGATVEIDGVVVGKTPYEQKVPGGYFHQTKSVFGKRLGAPMKASILLDGYVTRSFELTRGPMRWVALNGTDHGDYYLIKLEEFNVQLVPVDQTFKGNIASSGSNLQRISSKSGEALSIEDLVEKASTAVLKLETSDGWGSGFLVTDRGIVATNAHVVENNEHLTAKTIRGQTFNATVVYRDEALDLALVKLDVDHTPTLVFADTSGVRVGEDAIAVGNPAGGLQNTVTRGIVSALGKEPDYGGGTFIQTDASINPGNSGGPLFNRQGEVIGMNTFKSVRSHSGASLQGLGFALASSDIVAALTKLFPNDMQPSITDRHQELAKISVQSNVSGGEIYVDGKFVGNVGSNVSVATGDHTIEVRADKFSTWKRTISVSGADSVNLNATLSPQ
jgi:V8-like Glu-specific endopeptidase